MVALGLVLGPDRNPNQFSALPLLLSSVLHRPESSAREQEKSSGALRQRDVEVIDPTAGSTSG